MPLGSSLGIHRFFCDRDSVASVVVEVPQGTTLRRNAREESTPTRARHGRGESPGEGARALPPCFGRKAEASGGGPREPQERERACIGIAARWSREPKGSSQRRG